MAYAAVPAPQQLHLAGFGFRGTPVLQTMGYLLILPWLCRVCTWKLCWTQQDTSPPPRLFPPLLALILPGKPSHSSRAGGRATDTAVSAVPEATQALHPHLGSLPHEAGGLSTQCPKEVPAWTTQIAPGSHIRTADFLRPARGLGTGLEDFVSIISPAAAPGGFALWAWRASW